MLTPPDLEAVAESPVRIGLTHGIDMRPRSVGNPPRGQQPSTVPYTVIEQQLTQTGNRLNVGAQPAKTDVAGPAVRDPAQRFGSVERFEQSSAQVIQQPDIGPALHDRCRGEGRRLVVLEPRAGRMGRRR